MPPDRTAMTRCNLSFKVTEFGWLRSNLVWATDNKTKFSSVEFAYLLGHVNGLN